MEPGHVYRTYMWRQAQKRLIPNTVPLMVVRMRVKRAAELGLDYKTYASIRQFSGQDILGLLFSSNALRILKGQTRLPQPRARALRDVKGARKLSLLQPPLDVAQILQANAELDDAALAPLLTDGWAKTRQRLSGFIRDQRIPANQVLVVGDTTLEVDWSTAARAAGYLPAEEDKESQAPPPDREGETPQPTAERDAAGEPAPVPDPDAPLADRPLFDLGLASPESGRAKAGPE